MTIYMIILGYWFLLVGSLGQSVKYKLKNDSKKYVYMAGISLFVLMALRNVSVGTDTQTYLNEFLNVEYYLRSLIRSSEKGYTYLNYVIYTAIPNFQIYLSIISAFFIIVLSKLYSRFSENVLLSFYLHVTIGLFAMSMTGLRQTLAISFTMIAFINLMKNKKHYFFLFVLIAYAFHNSAIAFLPVYFLRNININQKKAVIIYTISASMFFAKDWITSLISFISPARFSRFLLMQDKIYINPLVILIALAIPFVAIVFWPRNDSENVTKESSLSVLFLLSCVNFIVYFFALEVMLLERISLYFVVYNTILIPNIIKNIKSSDLRMLGWIACIILPLMQFILSTPGGSYGIGDYRFFWE